MANLNPFAQAERDAMRRPEVLIHAPQATNAVHCTGEPLAPVIWQGEQWAVTTHGIEARDGTYSIHRLLLWEVEHGHHSWVHHVRGKGWADARDFALVYAVACEVFDVTPGKPPTAAQRKAASA